MFSPTTGTPLPWPDVDSSSSFPMSSLLSLPAAAGPNLNTSAPPPTTTTTTGPSIPRVSMNRNSCEPCHRAKTACDWMQPCARCIRLQRTHLCVPHQRKRPRKSDLAHAAATAAVAAHQQMNITYSSHAHTQSHSHAHAHSHAHRESLTFHEIQEVSEIPLSVAPEEILTYPILTEGNSANEFKGYWDNSTDTFAFLRAPEPESHVNVSHGNQQPFQQAVLGQQSNAGVVTSPSNAVHPSPPPAPITTAPTTPAPITPAERSKEPVAAAAIHGWDVESALRGPAAIPAAAFTPFHSPSFQSLLRRELESGRFSPYALTFHLTGLSEILCMEDWKRLAELMPIPVPPCSTRAIFASNVEFRNWWIARRLQCRPPSSKNNSVDASTPSSSRSAVSTPSFRPMAPEPSTDQSSSTMETNSSSLIAPHLCFLPMLFEIDYSSSPIFCVEDEQMFAGMVPRYLMMEEASLSQPLQPSFEIRALRQLPDSLKSKRGSRTSSSNKRERKRRNSRSSSRSRSSSPSSSSDSSSSSRSRSRSSSPARDTPSTSRRRRDRRSSSRRQKKRSRSRSHSRSKRSSKKQQTTAEQKMAALTAELHARAAAFDSSEPACEFDTLRTKHNIGCLDGKSGQETEIPVMNVLSPSVGASERVSDCSSERDSASDLDAHAASSSTSVLGQPRCGCPRVVRRRMHVQVNRAYERVLGWTQREVREMFMRAGQPALFEVINNKNSELFASFMVLLSGRDYFRRQNLIPLATRWGGSVQAHMSVKLIITANELDGWRHTWTVDLIQTNKSSSTATAAATNQENVKPDPASQ